MQAAPATAPGPDMAFLRTTALQDSSVLQAVAAAGLACPVEWAFAVDDDAARFLAARARSWRTALRANAKAAHFSAGVAVVRVEQEERAPTRRLPPQPPSAALAKRPRRCSQLQRGDTKAAPEGEQAALEKNVADLLKEAWAWTGPGTLQAQLEEDTREERDLLEMSLRWALEAIEPATLRTALLGWTKWQTWARTPLGGRVSGARCHTASRLQIERFFASMRLKGGSTAVAGVWRSLRFVNRHMGATLDLPPRVPRPPSTKVVLPSSGQAPAAPPQIFLELEAVATVGEPLNFRTQVAETALTMLGTWMRYRHLQRSVPTKLTTANLAGICLRGKSGSAGGRPQGV